MNTPRMNRRSALQTLIVIGGTAACRGAHGVPAMVVQSTRPAAPPAPAESGRSPAPRPPALAPALVNDFVLAAHSKIDVVAAMLASHPSLANATWDWGGGDFETALGAASHMGRADIATHLLDHGARMDLFCAAAIGKIDVVRAALTAFPGVVRVRGPHGISLLRHAEAGKHAAMVDLLKEFGAE